MFINQSKILRDYIMQIHNNNPNAYHVEKKCQNKIWQNKFLNVFTSLRTNSINSLIYQNGKLTGWREGLH